MARARGIAAIIRRAVPEIVALIGVLALSYGAWLVSTPSGWAGWIVFGLSCIGIVRYGTEAS